MQIKWKKRFSRNRVGEGEFTSGKKVGVHKGPSERPSIHKRMEGKGLRVGGKEGERFTQENFF